MKSEKIYYPPMRQHEPVISNKELERLFQEFQEEDFLLGKTRESLPDNWEDED